MADKRATRAVIKHIKENSGDNWKSVIKDMINEGLGSPADDPKVINPWSLHFGELWEGVCNPDGLLDATESGIMEVAEATVSTGFPQMLGRAVHKVWIPMYENNLLGAEQLVMEVDSDRPQEYIDGVRAADEPEEVREGEPVPETQLREKYAIIKNRLFQRELGFTRHTLMFDKSGGDLLRHATQYGEKMGIHRHRYIVEATMDYAISATGESANSTLNWGGSTRTMYGATHTYDNAATNDNAATESFGSAGMQQVMQQLALMKDEAGSETPIMPKTLLVSTFLLNPAIELVKAPGRFDSANRTINVFGPGGIQTMNIGYTGLNIIQSPIIDNSDATNGKFRWNLGDHAKQMRWQWVKRPTVEQIPGDLRRNIILSYLGMYWGGCGATDYRYAVRVHATSY